MNAWLVIFVGDTPDEQINWRTIDGDHNVVEQGRGDLSELSNYKAENTAIVISGLQVTCIDNVTVSVKSEKEALSIAKFAIEDDLAGKLGDTHVALGHPNTNDESGNRTLYAISNDFMNDLLTTLDSNNIEPDLVIPDYLCLDKEGAKAVIAEDFLSIRYGDWGASIDTSLGSDFVYTLLNSKAENLTLECVASYPDVDPSTYGFSKSEVDAFDLLASNIPNVNINLLQGNFALNSSQQFLKTPNLITIGAIVSCALLANICVTFFEIYNLNSNTTKLTSDTRSLFQQYFPQYGEVRDIRTQLRVIEGQAVSGEPDFLILSSILSIGVENVDGISVQSLRFDANTAELRVNVLFDSFDSLAQLTATIQTLGGTVSDGGSQQAGQRRSGELVIRRYQ